LHGIDGVDPDVAEQQRLDDLRAAENGLMVLRRLGAVADADDAAVLRRRARPRLIADPRVEAARDVLIDEVLGVAGFAADARIADSRLDPGVASTPVFQLPVVFEKFASRPTATLLTPVLFM